MSLELSELEVGDNFDRDNELVFEIDDGVCLVYTYLKREAVQKLVEHLVAALNEGS